MSYFNVRLEADRKQISLLHAARNTKTRKRAEEQVQIESMKAARRIPGFLEKICFQTGVKK